MASGAGQAPASASPVAADGRQFIYVDEDAISDELQCPLCLSPLTDPWIHADGAPTVCGSAFCRACIERAEIRQCPTCRGELTTLHPPQRLFANMLSSLPVICTRCQMRMERGSFRSHACGRPCARGCGALLTFYEMGTHEDVCPNAWVPCLFCGVQYVRAAMAHECPGDHSHIGACVVQAADVVELNIGGALFTTSRQTLCREKYSAMANFFACREGQPQNAKYTVVLDRDPTLFPIILAWLRDTSAQPQLRRPAGTDLEKLRAEAAFWGLKRMLKDIDEAILLEVISASSPSPHKSTSTPITSLLDIEPKLNASSAGATSAAENPFVASVSNQRRLLWLPCRVVRASGHPLSSLIRQRSSRRQSRQLRVPHSRSRKRSHNTV